MENKKLPAIAITKPEEVRKLIGCTIEDAKVGGMPPSLILVVSHIAAPNKVQVIFTPGVTLELAKGTMMGPGFPIIANLGFHIQTGDIEKGK